MTTNDNEPFTTIVMNPDYWEDKVLALESNDPIELDYTCASREDVWKDIGDRVSITLTRDFSKLEMYSEIIAIIKEEFETEGVEFKYNMIMCEYCGHDFTEGEWTENDEQCPSCMTTIDHYGCIVEEEEDHCNRCKTTEGNVDYEGLGVCKKCHIQVCG